MKRPSLWFAVLVVASLGLLGGESLAHGKPRGGRQSVRLDVSRRTTDGKVATVRVSATTTRTRLHSRQNMIRQRTFFLTPWANRKVERLGGDKATGWYWVEQRD